MIRDCIYTQSAGRGRMTGGVMRRTDRTSRCLQDELTSPSAAGRSGTFLSLPPPMVAFFGGGPCADGLDHAQPSLTFDLRSRVHQ